MPGTKWTGYCTNCQCQRPAWENDHNRCWRCDEHDVIIRESTSGTIIPLGNASDGQIFLPNSALEETKLAVKQADNEGRREFRFITQQRNNQGVVTRTEIFSKDSAGYTYTRIE